MLCCTGQRSSRVVGSRRENNWCGFVKKHPNNAADTTTSSPAASTCQSYESQTSTLHELCSEMVSIGDNRWHNFLVLLRLRFSRMLGHFDWSGAGRGFDHLQLCVRLVYVVILAMRGNTASICSSSLHYRRW